jgi:M6 family metalloprotease-like protein
MDKRYRNYTIRGLISMRGKHYIIAILIICLVAFVFVCESYAVPAAPITHTLTQPDGGSFNARQWGDESSHGWETEDGYSIIFDEALKMWTYAIHSEEGSLMSSSRVVGKHIIPDVQQRIRPKIKIYRTLSKEQAKGFAKKSTAGDSGPRRVVPSTGTANIPVILINFSDRSTTYSASDFDSLLFGSGNYSMKDYFEEVSYGKFSVSAGPAGITGWYNASNSHDYYGQNDIYGWDRWPGTLVREAVIAADSTVNFASYDSDGDCYVDVVNIVHQGSGEESGTASTDIWSHSWSLSSAYFWGYSSGGEYTTNDACPSGGYIKIDDYVIQPETFLGGMTTMGVFAHEYSHALGLPDLYDTDYSSQGVGNWSLMAGGSYNYATTWGDRPAHLDAWSKYYLGWVTPTQVSGTFTNKQITSAATTADVYQLLNGSPSSGGEYFLVENRQKTGFDVGLPGAGLLIWHIDESVSTNDDECYPGGTSCSTSHYHVALVQADNLYHLEKNINDGDSGDPYPGSANNTTFNSSSSPNSNLYNGSSSNVSVTNISASATTMTATLYAPASSTTPITQTITAPSNTTVSKGSVLGPFSVSVTNNTNSSYTFYVYPYIYTPDGNWVQLMSGKMVTLAAYQTISKSNLYLPVPLNAQTGTHYFLAYLYDTSSNIIDYDYFAFEVTSGSSTTDGLKGQGEWFLSIP